MVAELRDAGVRLPIIATAGIRDFDDCREYLWAGADAVSLGSAVWLRPMPLYALGPIEGLRIRRLIDRVARYELPERDDDPPSRAVIESRVVTEPSAEAPPAELVGSGTR